MASQAEQMKEQAREIERLKAELEQVKQGSEGVYVLPHTLRKGVGDLWRGYKEGRERPDNVPKVDIVPAAATGGPSNKDVVEFMAAQAIAEAQAEAQK